MRNSTAEIYQNRIDQLDRRATVLQSRDLWLSRTRGFAFLISLALLVLGKTHFGTPFYVLGIAAFAGFVALIGYHERVQHVLKITNTRRDIYRQQIARLRRDWSQVSLATMDVPEIHRGVAVDLDLFGEGSLWQLVNLAYTSMGKAILRGWLLNPASPQEIKDRQQAVARLAPMNSFREEVVLHGRMLRASDGVPDFIDWAEGPTWLEQRTWLKWIIRGLTLAMLVLPVAIVLSWLAPEWVLLLFGLLAINILINVVWAGSIHELFNRINAGRYDMLHYTALFQAVVNLPDDCPRLAKLKDQMLHDGVVFRKTFKRLQRIMKLANGRRSALFGVPYVIAQILWFWDFHMLTSLEKWQASFGHDVRRWFEAVGELEALLSFATLAQDNPAWCFAQVDRRCQSLSAVAMGHPLLPTETCVRNDVSVGPAGTLLLVTGSNMSGKSTLLRSLGVNTVLALAGAPVCAEQFNLPPVKLATSMRITDSLNSGVSFFMAELGRLKSIVDQAQQLESSSGPPLFYLLDEILQGTNTAERHIAVTRVIGHLLKRHTIGAVSTHDLELADADELRESCQTVHFRETIHSGDSGETMSFDYKLRPGIASTTNALQLLKIVGLAEN